MATAALVKPTGEEPAGKPVAVDGGQGKPGPHYVEDLGPKGYQGAGMTRLSMEQRAALMEPFADDEHDIKPTEFGEVYVSHAQVRRRLNTVIGPGEWTLVPVPDAQGRLYLEDKRGSQPTVCHRARLYIWGNFISENIGEQALASERMTYASACEGARSDALVRCCKDLSVGWECWDKHWTEQWRQRFALRVGMKVKNEVKWVWRRKDANPLRGEFKASDVKASAGGTAPDPSVARVSKGQAADLWALATERINRQRVQAVMKEILERHGVERAEDLPASEFKVVLAEIRRAK